MKIDLELRKSVEDYIREICHYSQMQVFSNSCYQKNFFQLQIDERINGLIHTIANYITCENLKSMEQGAVEENLQEFTPEELARYNGREGKPSYVAVDGIIYDVSQRFGWSTGSHFGLRPGQDQSDAFHGCHMGMTEVLDTLPRVGRLITPEN